MSNQVASVVREAVIDGQDDCEVRDRPRRRTFKAKYKLRILKEADACRAPGEMGALLRREGLYSSHLTEWRRARECGALAALGKKRGRKAEPAGGKAEEVTQLRKEVARLTGRLRQAEVIIDVQKKVASLLGIPLRSPDSDESDS
jgi:transposase-like protein